MKKAKIVKDKNQYRNLYKGQRCFLLGNGPSLNRTDLSMLEDEYTFACNKISLLYEKTGFYPSFYVMVSTELWRHDWMISAYESMKLGVPSFLNSRNEGINSTTKSFYEEARSMENVYSIPVEGGRKDYPYSDDKWSYNPMSRATKWGSIILTCSQIATFMGFSEIYLLGCDLGFGDKNPNFDPSYNPKHADKQGNIHSTEAHVLMKRMTEKVGTKVYNATIGGSLEVHPRVNYEGLFK